MNEQEIKKIVCAVVDYGWPWQYDDWQSPFVTAEDQSIGHLFHCFYLQECKPGYDDLHVRLDPNHPHDWPIEMREGLPVWAKIETYGPDPLDQDGDDIKTGEFWKRFATLNEARWSASGNMCGTHRMTLVAPHPLHPDQSPPDDWASEGRRILK